jgi:uncharacterized protein
MGGINMSYKKFIKPLKERRSIYAISKEITISDEKIIEIVEASVMYTPSAFNSQTARVVVLIGESHDKLWDITEETLRKIVPEDKFGPTKEKMNSFRAGYGTVLFFEDTNIVKSLQEQFPLYEENFPVWSEQSSGMLQLVVWTALEAEGLGASLQHYNPLIDDEVKKEWNIDSNWKLIGQMPFGKPEAYPGEKEFMPLEERIMVFK